MKIVKFAALLLCAVLAGACGSDSSRPQGHDLPIVNNPVAPVNPEKVLVTVGNGELGLNWSPSEGAESYTVWYATENNSTVAIEYTGDSDSTDTKCLISGLTNSQAYWFWVKAKNGAGTSSFSEAVTGIPADLGDNSVSVEDIAATEGEEFVFEVKLNRAPLPGRDVIVKWDLLEDSATEGYDFANTNHIVYPHTLIFENGQPLSKKIVISVTDDKYTEGEESFKFVLTESVNASISGGTATAIIKDNETAEYTIEVGDAQPVKEGDPGETRRLYFPVKLSPALRRGDMVAFHWDYAGTAVRGEDFQADSRRHLHRGEIKITGYTEGGGFHVDITGDDAVENDENLIVRLEDCENAIPVPGKRSATGTILNDDTGELSEITASMKNTEVSVEDGDEGEVKKLNVIVFLSDPVPAGKTAVISWSLSDVAHPAMRAVRGRDFNGDVSGTVTITEGSREGTISFETIGDILAGETDKKFIITLNSSAQVKIDGIKKITECTIQDSKGVGFVAMLNAGDPGSTSYTIAPAIADDGSLYYVSEFKAYGGSAIGRLYHLRRDLSVDWYYQFPDDAYRPATIGEDGSVYTTCEDGYFRIITPQGGDIPYLVRQQKFVYNLANPDASGVQFAGSPVVGSDGTIYGTVSSQIIAINPLSTPSEKWRYDSYGCPVNALAIAADGTIIYSGGYYLEGVNPGSTVGTRKWRFQSKYNLNSPAAIDAGGRIFVGTEHRDGKPGSFLYCVDGADGTKIWEFIAQGSIRKSPVIDGDGNIYFGTKAGKFYSLSPAGTERWCYDTAGAVIISTPAVGSSGTVYVGCDDGYLYAFHLNGILKWKYNSGRDISGAITIHNEMLYFATDKYNLHGLRITGEDLANSAWPKFQRDLKNTGRMQ